MTRIDRLRQRRHKLHVRAAKLKPSHRVRPVEREFIQVTAQVIRSEIRQEKRT